MRRPKLNVRLLLTLLLTIWVLASCSGSSKIPDPPTGSLYSVDVPDKKLLCADIKTGTTCPAITIDQADKYYAMSPKTWMDLENYIGELVNELKGGGTFLPASTKGGVYVYVQAQDLENIRAQMVRVRQSFHRKKHRPR